MENSIDPIETPCSGAFDLGLPCLLRPVGSQFYINNYVTCLAVFSLFLSCLSASTALYVCTYTLHLTRILLSIIVFSLVLKLCKKSNLEGVFTDNSRILRHFHVPCCSIKHNNL